MSYDRKLVFVTVPVADLFVDGKVEKILFDMPKVDEYEFDSVASSQIISNNTEAFVCAVYKSKKATF